MDLREPNDAGWAIVALFYSALHLVEALNAKFDYHCRSHRRRNDEIERNAHFEPIRNEYLDLFYNSSNARYEMTVYTAADYAKTLTLLASIDSHVRSML